MIAKSQPLMDFINEYRESGLDVAAFPSQKGDRFTLRIVDADDPKIGLGFLASFAKGLKEADRPGNDNRDGQILANRKLDDILHDEKQMARYSACHCVIDADSVKQFPDRYTATDIGRKFVVVSACGTALSDSYDETKEEMAVKSVKKDA